MTITFDVVNSPSTSPATRADVWKYFTHLPDGSIDLPSSNTQFVLNNLTDNVSGNHLKFEFNGTGFTYDGNGFPTGGTVTSLNIYAGIKFGTSILGPVLVIAIDNISWDANALINAVLTNNQSGFNAIVYGQDDFYYHGDIGKDFFTGSFSGDTLFGESGNDTLFGDGGDDIVFGGAGNDTLDGGAGTDTVNYSYLPAGQNLSITLGKLDTNTGNVAQSTATVKSGAVTIETDKVKNFENAVGGGGNDTLTGNAGDNVLVGFDGNDLLIGGAGADRLDGGSGIDTVSYAASATGVTVDLSLNDNGNVNDSGFQAGGDAENDRLSSIEILIGSAKDDNLKGTNTDETFVGGAGADIIDGKGGNDTLSFAGATKAVTVSLTAGSGSGGDAQGDNYSNIFNVIGGKGADVLTGDSEKNFIYGADGNDIIDGGSNADELVGGLGIDTLSYADSTGTVIVDLSTQGTSLVNGEKNAAGSAQNSGEADGDLIWGFENLTGGQNGDILFGDGGKNAVNGGTGDDTIRGGGANDTLDGGADIDTLDYSYLTGTQHLTLTLGTFDAKTLNVAKTSSSGVAGDIDSVQNFERVTGGAGNDKLTGNAGDNWLTGGDGADILIGGAGADRLHGSAATSVDLGNPGDTADYSASKAGITITISNASYSGPGKGGDAEGDLLAGINNIVGSKFNDFLSGDTGFNTTPGGVLSGGGGDDIIRAATYSSGAPNILDGGTHGTVGDTIDYSWASNAVAVTIALSSTKDALTSVTSLNLLPTSIKNFENVIGGAGDDTITGNNVANVIEGGAGADTLTGGGGTDTLSYAGSVAGVGVLLISGGQAAIFITGSDADGDIATGFINLLGSAANDTLQGDIGNNVIDGGAGNDTVQGHAGADTLFGGAGEDTLDGGAGADKIDGGTSGSDRDEVSYIAVTDNITLTLGANGAAAKVSSKAGNAAAGDTLTNIERVYAGDGNDALTGHNLDHDLRGDDGNDTLAGGTGSSFLYGENGDDIIFASVSNGGKGGDIGTETYSGGDDYDTLNFSKLTSGVSIDLSGDTAHYIPGTDDVIILMDFENVIGTNKDDSLRGNFGPATRVDGGAGNDIIEGGQTADTLIGGTGIDTLSYAHSDIAGVLVTLKAGQAADVGPGSGHSNGDVATGFENLLGSAKTDTLIGDTGNNVIEGGGEDDLLIGGLGTDTVSYAGSALGVFVDLALQGGTKADGITIDASKLATAQNGGDAQDDLLYNFENLIGSAHGDTLLGDAGNNTIDGGEGTDELRGFQGKDTLRGGADKDVFYAGGTSGIGADTYDGGADFDTLTYQDESLGVTVVLGANGASANVTGGPNAAGDKLIGIESVIGGNGNDKFTGNNLAHQLDGSDGDDTLTGGSGDSTVVGQGGNDTIVASIGANELYQGGDDNDTLTFASFGANTVVNVNFATNTHSVTGIGSLIDASGFEILIGGKGNDVLTGNAATATNIQGGAGNDTIKGGTLVDTFTGGAGNDTFVFIDAGQGKDVFTDFANGDRLQINSSAFSGLPGAGPLPDASWLVVGANAVVTPGVLHGQFIYNTTTDILSWDADGDGVTAAVEIGQFGSSVVLKLADFALVV